MRGLILAALAALGVAASSCGKPAAKPATPEEVGKELATFRQLFVPISSTTWKSMELAGKRGGEEHIRPNQFPDPYVRETVIVGGRDAINLVAYTSVLLAPGGVPMESMSALQYLRLFEHDRGAELARVIAPKGSIFIARDALPHVSAAAMAAGAPAEDPPYSVVRGAGR